MAYKCLKHNYRVGAWPISVKKHNYRVGAWRISVKSIIIVLEHGL